MHLTRRHRVISALVGTLAAFLAAGSAGAVTIDEYPLTMSGTPRGMTLGPDGNLWFTESNNNKIGRMTPSGRLTEFTIPTPNAQALEIAAGPDGNLWFTESAVSQIGRITTAGVITEFSLPSLPVANLFPWGITGGPDGGVWFTAYATNQIGRISTSGNAFDYYNLPQANSGPVGITSGPSGSLWFTEYDGQRIGQITTTGVITEFTVPGAGTGPAPSSIAVGPDGNLWFTESFGNKVVQMTPAGVFTEHTVPTGSSTPSHIVSGLVNEGLWFTEQDGNKIGFASVTAAGVFNGFWEYAIPTAGATPIGIANDSNGNVWFTEIAGGRVGRLDSTSWTFLEFRLHAAALSQPSQITSATGSSLTLWFTEPSANRIGRIGITNPAAEIAEFTLPTAGAYPYAIAAGPGGTDIWFTEFANKIGRITSAGVITEFDIPTTLAIPFGITAGPDGNLWFTEYNGNKIGRSTTGGAFTEFPIPTPGSQPTAITAGPDGNLWFAEYAGNKIGRITPAGVITEFDIPTPGALPASIISGEDGNLWFTEDGKNTIGRITTSGVVTEFPNPTAGGATAGIATRNYIDGKLWFVDSSANAVGRMTPEGTFAEYPIPTPGAGPISSSYNGYGELWFTEGSVDRIAVLRMQSVPQILYVTRTGTGSGTVTSDVGGISCGAVCSAEYPYLSSVVLTAAASAGSVFTGWPGYCATSGPCTVHVDFSNQVSAVFTGVRLTVTKAGAGAGSVVSSPGGIDCGATCTYDFTSSVNQPVTLTASAPIGSVFIGWSGEGCSGTGTCQVTMSQFRSVTATFGIAPTRFYPVSPCRVLDTRNTNGPVLTPGQVRVFPVAGLCGIPLTAVSVSANVTVTQETAGGYVSVYAGNAAQPPTSSISFAAGKTRANNARVGLSTDGLGTVAFWNASTGSTHAILDVSGYFQ